MGTASPCHSPSPISRGIRSGSLDGIYDSFSPLVRASGGQGCEKKVGNSGAVSYIHHSSGEWMEGQRMVIVSSSSAVGGFCLQINIFLGDRR